jgi:CRP-like cAMP-binding protein
MSLIDGEPRSTNCTALSQVQAAGRSRRGLELLMDQQPTVAVELLAEVAGIIANRLRALSDQLRLYASLTESMQREIDRLKTTGPAGR